MPVFSKVASLAQFRSLLKSPAASNALQTGKLNRAAHFLRKDSRDSPVFKAKNEMKFFLAG
jgi:hypothetical protein